MTYDETRAQFGSIMEGVLDSTWEFYPSLAAAMGQHQYDGKLPDISRPALSGRVTDLRRFLTELGEVDRDLLIGQDDSDYVVLESALRKELVDLTQVRIPETNPVQMLDHIDLSVYVKRDYAPLRERVVWQQPMIGEDF